MTKQIKKAKQKLYRYDVCDENGNTICHLERISNEKPSQDWIVKQIKNEVAGDKIATIAFIDTITETLTGEYFDSDVIEDDVINDIITSCS